MTTTTDNEDDADDNNYEYKSLVYGGCDASSALLNFK